jgi:hypothetical protein
MDNPYGRTGGRPRARRPITLLLALLALAAPLMVVGTASPAAAADCNVLSSSWTHKDGVSKISGLRISNCGSYTIIKMTVHDLKCDGRSAIGSVERTSDSDIRRFTNSKGCGTSQAFSYQYNGTFPTTFKVCQWAANSVTWSSVHCKTYTLAQP